MRSYKKMFAGMVMICSVFFSVLAVTGIAESQENYGAILVAHGSDDDTWNQKVVALHSIIEAPIDHFWLAFIQYDDVKSLKKVIKDLKNEGVDGILLIHLSPSSYSICHEMLKPQPQPVTPTGKVTKQPWLQSKLVPAFPNPNIPLVVTPAMDDHHLIVDTLKVYADELSASPGNDSLILLGFGAINELENIAYVRQLEQIGEKIHANPDTRFKEVVGMTLRYHSADLIREQAIIDLQRTVKRLGTTPGKVIIVPHVLWQGSFHEELQSYLEGIELPHPQAEIVISNKSLLSDSQTILKQWVEDVLSKGMEQPVIVPVTRKWHHMDSLKGDPPGTNLYGECKCAAN